MRNRIIKVALVQAEVATNLAAGLELSEMANIAPTNENGIVWGRTPQHALNIAYGKPGRGVMAGGFFPEGVNGRIRVT
jgi:hypothetical protein